MKTVDSIEQYNALLSQYNEKITYSAKEIQGLMDISKCGSIKDIETHLYENASRILTNNNSHRLQIIKFFLALRGLEGYDFSNSTIITSKNKKYIPWSTLGTLPNLISPLSTRLRNLQLQTFKEKLDLRDDPRNNISHLTPQLCKKYIEKYIGYTTLLTKVKLKSLEKSFDTINNSFNLYLENIIKTTYPDEYDNLKEKFNQCKPANNILH